MPFPKKVTYSLTTRLITVFILVIVVTTIIAGVPSFLLLRNELQNQTVARIKDGERLTKVLIDAEKDRLIELANHTAERPTLQRLLLENDISELQDYLQSFMRGVELDILFVHDRASEIASGDVYDHSCINLKNVGEATFSALTCVEGKIILTTTKRLINDQLESYYVTVGVLIDDEFARELAQATGFDQFFFVNERIAATSLEDSIESEVVSGSNKNDLSIQNNVTTKIINGEYYYTANQPLNDDTSVEMILNEVALQIKGLRNANQRALLSLIFNTFFIALGGSILVVLFSRNLIAPLNRLTFAARSISHGDFSSPVPIPDEPYEIATLAKAFEESRVNTQQYMDELNRAKAWSETVIQSIEEGILTFNDELMITSFNQGAQRITGWFSEEIIGKPLNEILRLPEGEGLFSNLIPPVGGKTQIEVLTRTGRKTIFAVTVTQLMPIGDEKAQTALVMRDITEEEATQSLQSYFLANISHEFRTPLSALNASVELMLDELDDLSKSEIDELLNSIHRSVTGLQTLIDNLLESIRIQAGRYQINRQPVEFSDVVLDAVGVMKPLLDRRRQEIIISQVESNQVVMVDPTRMTQVLVNLLSNASKYSPMDSKIELIVGQLDGHTLEVCVVDRGIGISPTDMENIFRRFVRLSDQDGAQYGIGLGLSVVKAIIEEHNGVVGVRANPEGGSIFWFTIPLNGEDE